LLSQLRDEVGARGCMLVGVDLHKPIDVLVAAYNDQRGVTAEFNLNLLRRINRELDADFDVDAFTHRAIYDREHGRIAMRLEAVRPQIVRVAAREFHVSKGEAITTEYSYKFTLEGFAALCRRASVDVARVWTDERRYFSVHLLNVK
jgi:uncharacterized SAM-dependent methyltransferase